jgi:hypothetical protein
MFACSGAVERTLRELDMVIEGGTFLKDPVLERLKSCPEAFECGKLFEKAFLRDRHPNSERLLPPTGVAMFV